MASIAYTYDCVKEAAFVADPNAHQRVGFVTSLGGFGQKSTLTPDLQVAVPYNSTSAPTFAGLQYQRATSGGSAKVVGVIANFAWNGGVGDAIKIDFWVSQQNAVQIKTMQQSVLTTTKINGLSWWIANYDQEAKVWYEQAYPKSSTTISGSVKSNPGLSVDLTPVPAKDGIDVYIYKVSIAVVPAANNAYSLQFANSAYKPLVKSWGLQVGTLASAAMP
jgi:hypothetical protein